MPKNFPSKKLQNGQATPESSEMHTDEDMLDFKSEASSNQLSNNGGDTVGPLPQKSKFWQQNGGFSRHQNVENISKGPRRSVLLYARDMIKFNLNDDYEEPNLPND